MGSYYGGINAGSNPAPTAMNTTITHSQRATAQTIIDLTAIHFGITPGQIVGKRQDADISDARHVAMYLLDKEKVCGKYKIAILVNRNHTVVTYAIGKVKSLLSIKDPSITAAVNDIENILTIINS